MRYGKKDFKGELYVGMRVRIARLPEGIKEEDVQCREGIIRTIRGRFLRTPDKAYIDYEVELDKPLIREEKKIIKSIWIISLPGEDWEIIEDGEKK